MLSNCSKILQLCHYVVRVDTVDGGGLRGNDGGGVRVDTLDGGGVGEMMVGEGK